jgi:hypothetical protein
MEQNVEGNKRTNGTKQSNKWSEGVKHGKNFV